MIRRRGATLLEVLVAIFVMGIGMLALLALFPLGVLTMRQAIQHPFQLRRVEILIKIIVDLDHRRVDTGTQAFDLGQGELAVVGHLNF